MKLIENADTVRTEILKRIAEAKSLEEIYRRQVAEAEQRALPYQRERWALEGLLATLDSDVVEAANDAALSVAAE